MNHWEQKHLTVKRENGYRPVLDLYGVLLDPHNDLDHETNTALASIWFTEQMKELHCAKCSEQHTQAKLESLRKQIDDQIKQIKLGLKSMEPNLV